MKAMILAAGFGERMRPLTDDTPKPLLQVAGKALIDYHIEGLVQAGFRDLVVNHAYLGEQIENHLGDGQRFGASIQYSPEEEPLNTAGGIMRALPLLGDEPFVVVNADIWIDYPFRQLIGALHEGKWGHLVLIDNPEHHREGDFVLQDNALVSDKVNDATVATLTFSGLSVLTACLFQGEDNPRQGLAVVLRRAMQEARISGEYYGGQWHDIGTPQRLESLSRDLASGC